jgi:hypothetical protein
MYNARGTSGLGVRYRTSNEKFGGSKPQRFLCTMQAAEMCGSGVLEEFSES